MVMRLVIPQVDIHIVPDRTHSYRHIVQLYVWDLAWDCGENITPAFDITSKVFPSRQIRLLDAVCLL